MKKSVTLEAQTMLDITLQELGDAERVFELAVDNDTAFTDELTAGTELLVSGTAERIKFSVVQTLSQPSKKPASADIAGLVNERGEGIEFWGIENDFVIS